eukprot:9862857-Alexandrium_andersonii.AAC.1
MLQALSLSSDRLSVNSAMRFWKAGSANGILALPSLRISSDVPQALVASATSFLKRGSSRSFG